MAKILMNDPLSSEARSPLIAGLTEAVNKLSGVLDLKTGTLTNFPLVEVYISDEDTGRMYQAPLGNKLWLDTPSPVFKKNGQVITPTKNNFSIDYLGGSIVFERGYNMEKTDVITVDCQYIIADSKKIDEIVDAISKTVEVDRIKDEEIDEILNS